MSQTTDSVRADFDRIARLTEHGGWDHNDHYHDFLLRHVPKHCRNALDIGCGTGTFTRRLAQRALRVVGVDLSPEMVRIARERSTGYPNVEYRLSDVQDWEPAEAQFDCIATIATLHHLPPEEMLRKMRMALRPGGTLLVLDLYTQQTAADLLTNVVAVPVNLALRVTKDWRVWEPAEVRAAWDEHGRTDVYPTLREVRRVCARVLPSARITRHLMWRYSVVWTRT
jgi:2-polyprenyl-3-methyl-5-hydroxy-6-metoxy-1,4-benzoquinol methylase